MESHYAPRPGVRWHPLGAVLAYDAQIAASGITTVFDSRRAGTDPDGSGLGTELELLATALAEARGADLFRAEHRTHLRCEIPSTDVVETVRAFAGRYAIGLLSLMDHTPGQRQFRDVAKYSVYAGRGGRSLEEIKVSTERKMRYGHALNAVNRPALVFLARELGIPLASHDDTTLADVALSPDILARRLAARGRPEDGDLRALLDRVVPIEAECTIRNDTDPDSAAAELIAHLRERAA